MKYYAIKAEKCLYIDKIISAAYLKEADVRKFKILAYSRICCPLQTVLRCGVCLARFLDLLSIMMSF